MVAAMVFVVAGGLAFAALVAIERRDASERANVSAMESVLCSRSGCDIGSAAEEA